MLFVNVKVLSLIVSAFRCVPIYEVGGTYSFYIAFGELTLATCGTRSPLRGVEPVDHLAEAWQSPP
jgi:hypothetical protein